MFPGHVENASVNVLILFAYKLILFLIDLLVNKQSRGCHKSLNKRNRTDFTSRIFNGFFFFFFEV